MKCCVSTDVGAWTNWLTFEPDPRIIVRMPEPDCFLSLLSYKRCNAEFYYVGENPTCTYIGRPSLQRGAVLKWFYSLRAVETPSSLILRIMNHLAYLFTEEFLVDNIYDSSMNSTYKLNFLLNNPNANKILKWKLATLLHKHLLSSCLRNIHTYIKTLLKWWQKASQFTINTCYNTI